MGNLIYILEGASEICGANAIQKVLGLVGLVLFIVKIAVPIILIALGTFEMVQAVASDEADAIKKAGTKLLKKAIAAIAVFLVPTIVALLMGLIGGSEYKDCTNCIEHPFNSGCRMNNSVIE